MCVTHTQIRVRNVLHTYTNNVLHTYTKMCAHCASHIHKYISTSVWASTHRLTNMLSLLIDYRALSLEYRALLVEHRALSLEYWALLVEPRALLTEYRAFWVPIVLLVEARSLSFCFLRFVGLFWLNVGLFWYNIGLFWYHLQCWWRREVSLFPFWDREWVLRMR